jgi:hypothetical protein
MSKFKIGDEVIIKESGIKGVIKGRETIKESEDCKPCKVRIEYIVKTAEGFSNWKCYSKDELKKVIKNENKRRTEIYLTGTDKGFKITLVGIVSNVKANGYRGKQLSIGYSICNPLDEYSMTLGIKIATHRAKNKPFSLMISDFNAEFNEDTVRAVLKAKGEYIVKNIERFTKQKQCDAQ